MDCKATHLILFAALFYLICLCDASANLSTIVTFDHFQREDAVLTCPVPQNWTFVHWVLVPYVEIIPKDFVDTSHFELNPDNYTLTIRKIREGDVGEYLCLLQDNQDDSHYMYLRVDLMQYVPNAWDEYKKNFIIAISCAAAFLALAGLVLLVYTCCFKPDYHELPEEKTRFANGSFEMQTASGYGVPSTKL